MIRYLPILLLFATSIAFAQDPFDAKIGGKTSPEGAEIQVDLPAEFHRKNISSRGQGCCTQTSVHHSALWQNVPQLQEFATWVQTKGLPGGSYPGEMKKRITAICKDRGMPEPTYLQLEGGKEVLEILRAALQSGRMPAVTYSFSPSGRYNRQKISHMVTLVHLDDKSACILDNNYIGVDAYEWITVDEFLRTFTGGRSGWAVILLDAGPPPFPWN